jgi:ATP-dependent DNA helicase RecG
MDVSLCLEFDGSPRVNRMRKGFSTTTIKGHDDTGRVECVWFNQPFRGSLYKQNHKYFVLGKAERRPSGLQIQNPIVEDYDEAYHNQNKLLPVYRLTNGLTQRDFRFVTDEALKQLSRESDDADNYPSDHCQFDLDACLSQKYGFVKKTEAYWNIHYPSDETKLQAARQRLAFEEFLSLQTAVKYIRNQIQNKVKGIKIHISQKKLDGFLHKLPFTLTGSQAKVLQEVLHDMKSGTVMNRLIQGDVGSGKTVIAATALFSAVSAGYQGAMMAPTEILVKQHFVTLSQMMENTGIRLGILIGSMKESEKKETKAALAAGEIDILLGTHAVIQEDVEFRKLGLVITDEQHRFGVRQRALLQYKGAAPHILVMSATPIPRTLAHILHGDLDLSVIDVLPPGRVPIKTYHVPVAYRERIYKFVKKHAQLGSQSYIVCPLVEESEKMDLNSAAEIFEELSHGYLSGVPMGLLHGRLRPEEKEDIMEAFAAGSILVLVSTTVIEVGVNVPNAVIMVIENAERFGLAQLHQLRGRVGRGEKPSFCILISDVKDENGIARMKVLVDSTDGFEIAEKDLELRGPGDLYGVRQHGIPEFRVANPLKDHALFELAQKAADDILENPEAEMYQAFIEKSVEKLNKMSDGVATS